MLDKIIDHVGSLGWEGSCWSHDNLSSKKLYPKFQFPAKCKKWLSRLKTSEESINLLVSRIHTVHEQMPVYMRWKLTISEVEQLAERAAGIYELGQELIQSTQVKLEDVQREFYDAWAAGSQHIDTEIQVVLMDKCENFTVSKVPTLKKLLDAHLLVVPVSVGADKAILLEVDEFNLLMNRLRYDETVFPSFFMKC